MPQEPNNSGWEPVEPVPAGPTEGWEPVEAPMPTIAAAPESTLAKVWRGINTPLIPEGRAEKEGHTAATAPPTKEEAAFGAANPRLGPLLAGAKRGLAGAYADTLETARGFTSPLGIATFGLGALGKAPGAVGRVASVGSKLAGVGFGAQGAKEAASGVYDMTRSGVTPENARKALSGAGQAVLGATATGGSKGVQEYLTEKLPLRMVNQLIKPSVADVKFGKNPGMAILEEKITGNSLPEMGDKVYDKLQQVGKEIDSTLQKPQNANKRIDTSVSLKPIDDAMLKAVQDGDRGLYSRLANLKQQYTQNWKQVQTKAGSPTIKPSGPRNMQMSPYEAVKFKRAVGDSTRWTGTDPFEDRLNAVKGQIYGGLKDQINQAVPEVQPLNERYSNLVGAGKAIERRIPVAERNAHWSLSDIALGASGHIPLAIARKVMSGPALKSRVAVGLSRMAPEP